MFRFWFIAGLFSVVLLSEPVHSRADTNSPETTFSQKHSSDQRKAVSFDTYILGPGDSLDIELLDLPELSGRFSIGPDGTIYLPRLRALYVEGLTIEELRIFLTQNFRKYVLDPEIYIRPIRYRPVRVYVGGEVKRPGYYTISGVQGFFEELANTQSAKIIEPGLSPSAQLAQPTMTGIPTEGMAGSQSTSISGGSSSNTLFPTVFDAIRAAQGVTPFTDLTKVQVTRRLPSGSGGGRIRTNLNFLALITSGDESQNIRLFDGDVLTVAKSPVVMREQLLKAGQTNLTRQFMQVYVSGRVRNPGVVTLPQGSSLVQAIDLAGGTKLLHGNVEFIRFTREGTIDRRVFKFRSDAPADDYRNPVLMAGDVVRLRESIASAGIEVLNEITAPVVGLYSIYSIYRDIQP